MKKIRNEAEVDFICGPDYDRIILRSQDEFDEHVRDVQTSSRI